MTAPPPRPPVAAAEELRRALHEAGLDHTGRPTSGNFRTDDMSVDVGSLATIEETRQHHPGRFIAQTFCHWFLELGYQPVHEPEPANPAHAIVPGKLTKTHARTIANRVTIVYPPAA